MKGLIIVILTILSINPFTEKLCESLASIDIELDKFEFQLNDRIYRIVKNPKHTDQFILDLVKESAERGMKVYSGVSMSNTVQTYKHNSPQIRVDSIINQNSLKPDSIAKKLDSLLEYNSTLLRSLAEIKNSLEKDTSDFDYFEIIVIPLILSLISALVFWVIFSYYPIKKRAKIVRPKIEHQIVQKIYFGLFFLIDNIMGRTNIKQSGFAHKIESHTLTKTELELGLSDKCFNQTYFYDKNINANLINFGDSLKNTIDKVTESIDRLFVQADFLSAKELNLLNKIRERLLSFNHPIKADAISNIGHATFAPVNPSLSGRTHHFWELFEHLKELIDIILKYKIQDNTIKALTYKIPFYSGKYRKCIRVLRKHFRKYPNEKSSLVLIESNCQYFLGRMGRVFRIMRSFELSNKMRLVNVRNYLQPTLRDRNHQDILVERFGLIQFQELRTALDQEENYKNENLIKWKKLIKYYNDRANQIKS